MIFNRYVLSILVTCLLASGSLFLVISKLDPFVDKNLAVPLFFITLYLAVSSFFTLIGYISRMSFFRHELFLNHFNISLRQGFILGLSMCGLIGLQMLRTLTWWNALILIFMSLFLELYFVAKA